MKYMGSKRVMLQNGLGTLLDSEILHSRRFVDLFTGSGVVAWFVATRHPVEVIACDLQRYSVSLANAVIGRKTGLNWEPVWSSWYRSAQCWVSAMKPPTYDKLTKKSVQEIRDWCGGQHCLPITSSYGGHYFSAKQALWFDALRRYIPRTMPERDIALAALIQAANECAAAPGHTAQPFQPTKTAKRFLEAAWGLDVCLRTKNALISIAKLHAHQVGRGDVCDANDSANKIEAGDLVFVDPPYSGVHYSRFYHVLETVARGESGEVSGVGRYPSIELRPHSRYSVKSESKEALDSLLQVICSRGAKVILTFPDHDCSNGLSGLLVKQIAQKYFSVQEQSVESKFSTLGGNSSGLVGSTGRDARRRAKELILVLTPK